MPSILADFGTKSDSLGSFTITIYVLGFCVGPLLVGPASELYGRMVVLYPGFILYLITLAICGSSTNIAAFIVVRGVMGVAGITFLICGSAIIADIIPPQRRGLALSIMTSGATMVSRIKKCFMVERKLTKVP